MTEPVPPAKTQLLGQALTIFRQVVELPVAGREEFLARKCQSQAELREHVEELLAFHASNEASFATAHLQSAVTGSADEVAEMTGRQLGGYRILGRAGAGGMGVVYRAEQDSPRREVALKLMRIELDADETRQRFRREVQLLAQLSHPGIAQVYDSGVFDTEWGSVPYFAMELIDGVPIDRFVEERQFDQSAICELMTRVCEAAQHAHEAGVVHRDLKPSNVLVTSFNDTVQPKIVDFGIARNMSGDSSVSSDHTLTGQLLGTLGYISPEQTQAAGQVDHRADVYSLGVLLFELLTNKLPFDFDGRSLSEVATILEHENPTRLSSFDPALRGDLESIVEKAIAHSPDHRYSSALELAADLRRYLRSEPIRARPFGAWYYLRKTLRRHRAVFLGAAATVLALTVGLIVAITLAIQNDELAVKERGQREAAQRSRDELSQTLYRSEMRFVARALHDPRGRERARALLDRWRDPDGIDPRDYEWHLAQRLAFTEELTYSGCRDAEMIWTADGIRFVRKRRWVRLDPATGITTDFDTPSFGWPWSTRSAADGDRFVYAVRDALVVARFSSGEVELRLKIEGPSDARISPDGRYVAASCQGSSRNTIAVYDTVAGKFVGDRVPVDHGNRGWEFAHDDRRFAVAYRDELRIFARDTMAEQRLVKLPVPDSFSMAWSCDDKLLAIGHLSGEITIVDAVAGAVVKVLSGHQDRLTALRWDRSGARLLSAGWDSTIRLWQIETGEHRVLGSHYGEAWRVCWSPDEKRVASNGFDEFLRVFDVERPSPIRKLPLIGTSRTSSVAWVRGGEHLLVDVGDAAEIRDPATGGIQERLTGGAVHLSSGGRHYAALINGRIQVRSIDGGEAPFTHPAWKDGVLRWHPREDVLAVGASDSGVWIYRASERRAELISDLRSVHQLGWNTAGTRLSGMADSTYSFFLERGEGGWAESKFLHPEDPTVWAGSPDGGQYLFEHRSNELIVFAQDTGKQTMRLIGHEVRPQAAAWHPGGTRIASGDVAGSLRLWDAATGEEVFSLAMGKPIRSVAWSPNGNRLAVEATGEIHVIEAR